MSTLDEQIDGIWSEFADEGLSNVIEPRVFWDKKVEREIYRYEWGLQPLGRFVDNMIDLGVEESDVMGLVNGEDRVQPANQP